MSDKELYDTLVKVLKERKNDPKLESVKSRIRQAYFKTCSNRTQLPVSKRSAELLQ